jgi:hypothetical protein
MNYPIESRDDLAARTYRRGIRDGFLWAFAFVGIAIIIANAMEKF